VLRSGAVLRSQVLPGSDLRLPGSEMLRSPALLCTGPVLRSQVLPGSDLRLPGSEVLRSPALLCAGSGLRSQVLPGSDLRLPGSEVLRGPALLCAGPVLCSQVLRSRADLLPGPDVQQLLRDGELLSSPGSSGIPVRRSREGRLLRDALHDRQGLLCGSLRSRELDLRIANLLLWSQTGPRCPQAGWFRLPVQS